MKNKFSVLQDEDSNSDDYESGPWCKVKKYFENDITERLEHELLDIETWLQPTQAEKHIRLLTITRFINVIEASYPGCSCIPQGSSANETYLPTSDIDLIVIGLPEGTNVIDILKGLTKIFWKSSLISNAHLIPNAAVPIIKLIERPFGFYIDICVSNINGILNIPRVKNYLSTYKYLRPLLVFLKLFTLIHKIDDPATGGFGSNQLLNIALFAIQACQNISNLGQVLLFLLDVLGNKINYFLVGFSTVGSGALFSKWRLDQLSANCPQAFVCEDPQFHDRFIGIHTSKSLELASLCKQALNAIIRNDPDQSSPISSFIKLSDINEITRRRSEIQYFYTSMTGLKSSDFGRITDSTSKHIENKYEIAKAEKIKAQKKAQRIHYIAMKSAGQKVKDPLDDIKEKDHKNHKKKPIKEIIFNEQFRTQNNKIKRKPQKIKSSNRSRSPSRFIFN